MALYICFCLTIMFHWWPDSCFQCVMMLCDSKFIMINCLFFHPTHCYFHFSHRVIHRGVTMGTNEESSLVPCAMCHYPLYTWCRTHGFCIVTEQCYHFDASVFPFLLCPYSVSVFLFSYFSLFLSIQFLFSIHNIHFFIIQSVI